MTNTLASKKELIGSAMQDIFDICEGADLERITVKIMRQTAEDRVENNTPFQTIRAELKRTNRVLEVATLKNAEAYAATQEKYTFCADLLECSVDCDYLINMLEDYFDAILATR